MEIIFVLKNRRENGERLESDRDSNSSSFSPFLVLRLLTVSVTVTKGVTRDNYRICRRTYVRI